MNSPLINSLPKLINKQDLTYQESQECVKYIFSANANDIELASWLTALSAKSESLDEISAFIDLLKEQMIKIKAPCNALDIVGTGGDSIGTYNISTSSAFVVASCNVPVAKHGNRAISSRSGSCDILEALNINTKLSALRMEQCLTENNMSFLFAQLLHPTMKHVANVRKTLKIRSVFNLLGPMINPARVTKALIGVFNEKYCRLLAQYAQKDNNNHYFFVHSNDGLDEISICDTTLLLEVKNGNITEHIINPQELGFPQYDIKEILGKDANYNASKLEEIFTKNISCAYKDAVIINSSFALLLANKATTIQDAIELAKDAINTKKAWQKVQELQRFTNESDF